MLRKTNQYTPSQRLKFLMDGFKKATKENKDIISLSDTNIDTSPNGGSGHRYYSSKVEREFLNYIEENQLTIMNEEYTRHMNGQDPSCIDHIMTNSPKKLKDIATHVSTISDHEIISATYHPDGRKPTIAEKITRNTKNITSDNMEKEL